MERRKAIRLPNYDYTQNGAYFVTICTRDRRKSLAEVRNGQVLLTPCGKIVDDAITKIETLHPGISVPQSIVMPNHVHFIVCINRPVGVAYYATPTKNAHFSIGARAGLPKLIQQFKTAVVKACKEQQIAFGWQRGYYDHVVRDERDYRLRFDYIADNPRRWHEDEYYA